MIENQELSALLLTFRLALVSTLILLVLSAPLAWWLARTKSRFRTFLEATVALPLVLPPTVLGFYLLIAFSPDSWPGSYWYNSTGSTLAFSFTGLVIGSVIYSLPFVVQPLQNSFYETGIQAEQTASLLGAGKLDRFFSIAIPLARHGFLTAATLGFAHTLGEFGVVLMIGGNIPGETQVASILIFEHVETLQFGAAHKLAAILVGCSFLLLVLSYRTRKTNSNLMFKAAT